jgi:hypothetical protein
MSNMDRTKNNTKMSNMDRTKNNTKMSNMDRTKTPRGELRCSFLCRAKKEKMKTGL